MYLTHCRHVVARRKIVFRSENTGLRDGSSVVNVGFARRMQPNTAEFGLMSADVTAGGIAVYRCSEPISASKRSFPAAHTHIRSEQSTSFIRICTPHTRYCPDGYHAVSTASSPDRSTTTEPPGGEPIDTRPSTPPMNPNQHDWTPMESSTAGARCRNCGTHVTQQFARVFGDNGDIVHGCPSCTTYREMQSGGHLPGE